MKKFLTLMFFCGLFMFSFHANAEIVCDNDTCYQIPRNETIVGKCTEEDVGKTCPDAKNIHKNATGTICVNVKKNFSSKGTPSCAATECNDGYLLWLSGGKSMGVCHSVSYAETQCTNHCGNCPDGQECRPWLKPTPRTHKTDGAYDDCSCQPKKQPDQPKDKPVVDPTPKDEPKEGPCDKYPAGSEAKACCEKANQENPETKDFAVDADGNVTCNCVDTTKEWNKESKTCEEQHEEPQPEPDPCDSYDEGSEAKACCEKANQENPETKDFAVDADGNVTCTCVDTTKEWKPASMTCEPKVEEETGPCDSYDEGSEAKACCEKANQENPETKDFSVDADGNVTCNCVDTTKEWNKESKICEPKPTDEPEQGPCDSYDEGSEAKACCEKAQGDNAIVDIILENEEYKSCKCKDENKVWNKESKTCEPKLTKEPMCVYKFTANITCKDGVKDKISSELPLPKSLVGKNCPEDKKLEFDEWIKDQSEEVKRKVAELCPEEKTRIYTVKIEKITPKVSEDDFKKAKKTVDNFFTTADKNASVWKDAEGKFNSARLASDLTAGVVLGTVGGVVSGVVIKKKQIEKGFEVLHCDVGGQKMANWGDTFTIGLAR